MIVIEFLKQIYRWLRSLFSQKLPAKNYVFGVDVGIHEDTVISILEFRDGFERAVIETKTQNVFALASLIGDLKYIYKPKAIVVDDGGLGRVVIEELRERGFPIHAITITKNSKEQMFWNLKNAISLGAVKFCDDRGLVARAMAWDWFLTWGSAPSKPNPAITPTTMKGNWPKRYYFIDGKNVPVPEDGSFPGISSTTEVGVRYYDGATGETVPPPVVKVNWPKDYCFIDGEKVPVPQAPESPGWSSSDDYKPKPSKLSEFIRTKVLGRK
jgi:hypothetical protein